MLGLMPPPQAAPPATGQTFWAGQGELGGALQTVTPRPDSPVCGGYGQIQVSEGPVGPWSTSPPFNLCPL